MEKLFVEKLPATQLQGPVQIISTCVDLSVNLTLSPVEMNAEMEGFIVRKKTRTSMLS